MQIIIFLHIILCNNHICTYLRPVTYDSVAVGVPEYRVSVSPGRAGQVQEERVGAPCSATDSFDVSAYV